jgi:hypothetical protein
VTVHAGAVGPERLGPDDEPLNEQVGQDGPYIPSWNMIDITRLGDELRITIEPRVWAGHEPKFVPHPDGIQQRRVRLDLSPIQGPGPEPTISSTGVSPDRGFPHSTDVEHPGTNSSPLIPESTEVQSGVPLPSPAERSALRDLAVSFMRQTPTRRLHIAEQLGVADGLAELNLSSSDVGREILLRIRTANKINELREQLDV